MLKLTLKSKPATPAPSGEIVHLCEEMTAARELLDEAKALADAAQAALLGEARALRAAELRSGVVTNLKCGRVQVVHRESFRGISGENIPGLRAAFRGQFARVVEEETKVGFKKGTTLEAIEAAVGPGGFIALLELLSITESVKPRKGATEACAEMFRNGETEMAEDLRKFIEACISAPQVRVK